jgi:hypothetical protein
MKKVLLFLFLLFICGQVYAESAVLINELSIEPTQSVEIISNTNETLNISHWIIDDNGGTTYFTIPDNTLLYADSCLIFSGNFNLNKSSADTIRLFDDNFLLIDSFNYPSSPGNGMSYFRLPDKSSIWTNGISSLGNFNQNGENCLVLPTAAPTTIPTITSSPTVSIEPTLTSPESYQNIYLSEVMVAPESGDKEWVELYNNNDFSVILNNWYIDDAENAGASPKVFSLIIPAKSYAAFDLSSSMFNNDTDSVRLLDWQKQPKDSFEYNSSIKGKTLGRISFDDDTFCLQEPTKEQINTGCIENETTSSTTTSEESKITPTPSPSSIKSQNQSSTSTPLIQHPTGSVPDPTGSVSSSPPSQLVYNQSPPKLLKPFSFLSFSYSLLTIASILLKMKFNL